MSDILLGSQGTIGCSTCGGTKCGHDGRHAVFCGEFRSGSIQLWLVKEERDICCGAGTFTVGPGLRRVLPPITTFAVPSHCHDPKIVEEILKPWLGVSLSWQVTDKSIIEMLIVGFDDKGAIIAIGTTGGPGPYGKKIVAGRALKDSETGVVIEVGDGYAKALKFHVLNDPSARLVSPEEADKDSVQYWTLKLHRKRGVTFGAGPRALADQSHGSIHSHY